jgi:hypothetical protein
LQHHKIKLVINTIFEDVIIVSVKGDPKPMPKKKKAAKKKYLLEGYKFINY